MIYTCTTTPTGTTTTSTATATATKKIAIKTATTTQKHLLCFKILFTTSSREINSIELNIMKKKTIINVKKKVFSKKTLHSLIIKQLDYYVIVLNQ